MAWWQEWWVWMAAAGVLGIVEVALPGFVFLGFAIGALLTGALLWLGLLGGSPGLLALVFAVASLAAWLALRSVFGLKAGQVKVWDKDINEN